MGSINEWEQKRPRDTRQKSHFFHEVIVESSLCVILVWHEEHDNADLGFGCTLDGQLQFSSWNYANESIYFHWARRQSIDLSSSYRILFALPRVTQRVYTQFSIFWDMVGHCWWNINKITHFIQSLFPFSDGCIENRFVLVMTKQVLLPMVELEISCEHLFGAQNQKLDRYQP